ncbi:hypothetical protein F2Q70_00010644 [Brassica cretica]|uniref:Uncharacterized protein n=1 Tax=Brassica cretica TaxID=69181 RepID=A0A8S9M4F9_BRACR|nr:hypothetical protein F2Q70_00010644 [Brassica cretica]
MSQSQMEEISSQFTPRNNRNKYDFVYILHGAPPPPPPQDMSEHYYLKEQLEALFEIIADLYPDFASAWKDRRGTDLERGETSRDQREMAELDQTTSTAVAADLFPRDGH